MSGCLAEGTVGGRSNITAIAAAYDDAEVEDLATTYPPIEAPALRGTWDGEARQVLTTSAREGRGGFGAERGRGGRRPRSASSLAWSGIHRRAAAALSWLSTLGFKSTFNKPAS